MMRRAVANLLRRRTTVELLGRNIHRDTLCFDAFISRTGISTAPQNNDKVYASYRIYKGKTALSVEPMMPKYSRMDSGGIIIERQGVMLLKFSPAIGERKYDWEKKQLFALSLTETGSLISMGPNDSCEFFHDPSMKSSNAGQVRKSLKIRPSPGGSGYFFSLSVANSVLQTNESLSIPVSHAEFAVMRTAFSYALPHMMGWSRYASQQPPRLDSSWKRNELMGNSVKNLDLEWEK